LVALYVTSLKGGSGKTAVCAGLIKHLLGDGKKVGFFKPIIADITAPTKGTTDSDTAFIKRVFALKEPVTNLCPIISDHDALANRIQKAYAAISRGKDVVIVEGVWRQRPGGKPIEAPYEIVKALDTKVLIVEAYSKEWLKEINNYKDFGQSLLGVVLNKVPKSRIEQVRSEASAQLDKTGINIIGVLPEDRVLLALTIGELAEHIQGKMLRGAEQSAELVENFMLGAMAVDPGPDYFGRKNNKAVVVRSERPDMQMAAMQTSTRCLVLSGETALKSMVLDRAEEKNVPIILARDDVNTVVSNIENALGKTKFNHENKLPKLTEIIEQYLDFQTLYKGLGLAG
jgi:BioD-like phosphotransacetylase family protein